MKLIVVIVGRFNVGKLIFFNRFIGERWVIVDDILGIICDRIIGEIEWRGIIFNVIDMGGIELYFEDIILK